MKAEYSVLLSMISQYVGRENAISLLPVNWDDLVSLAVKEGVGAIVCDALQNAEFDVEAKYQLMINCIQMESIYEKYELTLSHLARFCRAHAVKILVLKGYGLSLNYPMPSHRPCGDIDVFLFGNDENINKIFESELGLTINRENSHHSSFLFEGFLIENHHTFLDIEDCTNHIADEQLFNELLEEGCTEISVKTEKCFVPSVKFNSVYLLRHMAHHFSIEKITLRHVLDWAMFVRTYYDCIDWSFVWSYSKNSGCYKFLNCLNGICVDSLGFPASMFPILERYVWLQKRMLNDILTPYSKPLPTMNQNFFVGIPKAFRMLFCNWKYRMCCKDSLLGLVWRMSRNRVNAYLGI